VSARPVAGVFHIKKAGWKDDTAYKKPSAAEIEQRRKARAERDALAAQQELLVVWPEVETRQ